MRSRIPRRAALDIAAGAAQAQAQAAEAPSATLRLVRGTDQLDLLIELFDVAVSGSTVTVTGADPRLRLTFGPQHLAEEGFLAGDAIPITPAAHVSAGTSSVVASIPADFDLTVDAILDLAGAAAGLSPATALELPRGLRLTPAAPALLDANRGPFTHGGTTEVWTARLERSREDGEPLELTAVANVATVDVAGAVLDGDTRNSIVDNTATDAPLTSSRLWLTSAGAFADLHGEWTTDLALYEHRLATGRDLHVEVQSLGYLLPFGHRAAITEVAERVLLDDDGGGQTAVIRRGQYLTLVDPTVTGPRPFDQHDGRGLPLMRIDASVSETTEVVLVDVLDADGVVIAGVSDITAGGSDLMVSYVSTDRGGNTVGFELPATLIDDSVAHGTGAAAAAARLIEVANGEARRARREMDLHGQPVAYADPVGGLSEAVSKATHGLSLKWAGPTFDATTGDLEDARTPAVFAAVDHADVVDDVIGAVTGEIGELVGVTLHERWLENGNDPDLNFDLAFLTIDPDQVASSVIGAGSPVRGVAQLELFGEVFNQMTGIGPKLDSLIGDFDIADLIGEASKIIGNISLQQVIAAVAGDLEFGADLPGTTVTIEGNSVVARFTYCPKLQSLDEMGFKTFADTVCCVHLTTTASLDDGIEATFTTEMRVEHFAFEFPPRTPLVVVTFDSVVATVHSDGSTSVVPTIAGWDFSGMLSLLVALVDKLGLGNVDLKILADKLDLDSSVNLPDLSLGVAELKNFAINLGLDLPLDGAVPGQLSFGIGSKSAPLDIDIMMFGATFWLDFDLGFNGPGLPAPAHTMSMGVSVYWEMLDFDIVVVTISFTLRLSADWRIIGDEIVFTGAVSLEGEISVFGLAEASASIVCSLTYRSEDETLVLKGTVHYCVDTFLGEVASGTVPIGETTIELGDGTSNLAARAARRGARALGAAPGGAASFGDRYSTAEWNDYCDAFA